MEVRGSAFAMKSRLCVDVVISVASVFAVSLALAGVTADAQTGNTTPQQATAKPQPAQSKPPAGAEAPAGVPTTPDYVIGPDDVLTVIVWREKEMSADVAVRPDGKISLPLLNDVQAAGLTPEQLRGQVTEAASKYVEEPNVTVVVKAINSRKIFVTGQVGKPGPYPLIGAMSVMQALSVAGGVLEYADIENISILRTANGKQESFRFNYKEVTKRKNLKQNIELKPGDTIVVP
jgi:polysaccharide export outer membrane protein